MLLLFNKSESLECAKVVVLKLGAIFAIAESIIMKKGWAEHLPSFWNRGLGELGNGLVAWKK